MFNCQVDMEPVLCQ